MKKFGVIILVSVIAFSCKQDSKSPETEDVKEEIIEKAVNGYPETLVKVFDAHGGLDKWKTFLGLYFEIERSDYQEKYTVDLKDRRSRIEYKSHVLGYDGKDVWVKNLDTLDFKGNPRFYYNLMFYFYAMPFILGDDGIRYAEADPLNYEGTEYPGISISYDSGVGESPEDEYILYYNPRTFRMEWLAYTVTFFTKAKSDRLSLIKYHAWNDVDGLQLPSVLQWHEFTDGAVSTQINEMFFVNAKLQADIPADENFTVVEGAAIAE